MREALFVKQKTEKWKSYEQLQTSNPDELAQRFIDITNDLAYAKTFYPKSRTTAYLNGIAAQHHQSIYKNKKEEGVRFVIFWTIELPQLFFKYRKQLIYSFLFFSVFTAIGVLSAIYDDQFVRLILGNGYVNMTNENIAKGDPFGVYKHMGEMEMFFAIFANNAWVSLVLVCSGILVLGPIYFLMKNAIMLGSFQYYFFAKKLGFQSILVIWIHGTIEISCIIIAGAAGLILANGLVFPKTYSRKIAFAKGAKDALKIGLGIIPLIFIAAFLESFITRHTEMPTWLSLAILISSATFMVWYTIIYPSKLNKRILINNETTS